MKKYIIAATLILNFAIVACSSSSEEAAAQKKKGYELKGRFKTFKNINKIELTEVSFEGVKTIDSTQIDEKGEFNFKGTGSTPRFYLIRYSNSTNIPVYLDSTTHLEIVIEPENREIPFTVKGDKNNEELQYYFLRNNESYKSISEMSQKFRSGQMPDSLKGSMESTMQALFDERAKKLQKLVADREPSAGAVFCALYLIPPPGQDQQQSMQILESYLKEFEVFYVDLDKKHFERFGKEPSFARIHKFVKAQSSTAIGTEMENFTLNNPDGKPISLKDFRGKYVLVDFWASWCRPCRMENPNVLKAYAKYHSKGFEVLGVSLDNDKAKWVAAIKSDGLDWAQVCEMKAWDADIARKFNVSSIPFSVLVDKNGKIVGKNLRGEALDEKLKEVFGE